MVEQQAVQEYEAAAQALVRAIQAHTAAVLDGGSDSVTTEEAFEQLTAAQHAYYDSEYRLTGVAEDDEDESADLPDGAVISVLRRHDYVVTDPEALLASGRAAYLQVWPDDSGADAAQDVTHVGRALYQVAHAGGWDSLRDADGLLPIGGASMVVAQGEPLHEDPDVWFEQLGVAEDDLVYSQFDVFRG